jgi:ABC-type nitrate/sulfonate/bicarbonate transport system substrate-binding protein
MNAATAGFANFSALDLFTSKSFHREHRAEVEAVVDAVREGIRFIHAHPAEAHALYYAYSGEEKTPLKDAILRQTDTCFRPDFTSDYREELPILHFFREIGITDLPEEKFRTAFLR